MAMHPEGASWSSLQPMDPAQHPRGITKSDVPLLSDRVRDVAMSDAQYRSGWETTTYVIGLLLLMTASSVIWQSPSSIGLKLMETFLALVTIGAAGTAVLVKLRFMS